MDPIEKKTAEKKEYSKTGKYLVLICIVFSFVAVLALMGYYAGHNSEVGQWPQAASTPEVVLTSFEEVDVLKFIPQGSLVMQKVTDDIDNDGKKEVIIFYLVDPKDFVYPSKDGKLNFMILKSDAGGKYSIAWQYFYGSMSFLPDYTKDRIYVYEKETDMPKIKFFINDEATDGINFFVYYDKNTGDFKSLKAINEDTGDDKISIRATSIIGPIEMKDTDKDGLQEIHELVSGYIYKLDENNRVYKAINSCLATKTIPKTGDTKTRIYRDERYDYEIEFPIKSRIICNNITVRLGEIIIFAPIRDVDISKIDDYKCKVGKETMVGSTPSGTHSIECKKFYTNSGYDVFKKTNFYPHDGSFDTTYSLIKKENSQKFTIIQITTENQGTGEGEYNNAVETFKFTN